MFGKSLDGILVGRTAVHEPKSLCSVPGLLKLFGGLEHVIEFLGTVK